MTHAPPPPPGPAAYGIPGGGGRQYQEIAASVPTASAQSRYAECVASYAMVMSTPQIPRPESTYDASYHQLPQDRFYQFRMWLQSPEGQNYKRWESEARAILDVIEPFNARWAAGWMEAESAVLRPILSYLSAYDGHTRQLLTYSDLNPMARQAHYLGQSNPYNPTPYEVLRGRLPERSDVQRELDSSEEFWQSRFGVELGSAWRTPWGPNDVDPQYIAGHLRHIIDSVTSRLWADSELPQVPALPKFGPPVKAVPESMATLVVEMAERTSGERIPSHQPPEAFAPPEFPQPMAAAGPRWARGGFTLGRAVAVGGRQEWAEAVALEVAIGQQPMAKVQRYDGSIAWFEVNDVLGIR